MRTLGKYVGPGRTLDGNLTVTFEIDDDYDALDKLTAYKGAELVIETKKYYEKKSQSANGYFWHLVCEIAAYIGSDKMTVYLWLLRDHGVSFTVKVAPEAVKALKETYRIAEVWDERPDEDGNVEMVCYIGVRYYDKKQMGYLIDRTVEVAKNVGVDTWTPDEIAAVVSVWEAEKI